MRVEKRFCARMAVRAGVLAAAVSGFGPSPVHAQTPAVRPGSAPAVDSQSGPVRRLSIDDAVATALEQNLDLQVQRFNPQLQDYSVSQFKAAYTPNFVSTVNSSGSTQPSTSFLSGNQGGITNGATRFNFGLSSLTSWYGGSYDVRWNNARNTTNNAFSTFNPQLNSSISATYSQPLLKNFKINGTQQQLFISQRNKDISDTQLQQSIAQTTRTVRNAYYDLI